MTTKTPVPTETVPTLNEGMSFWAMFKHIFASTGNVTLNLLDGTNKFASGYNHLGGAVNTACAVVEDYALIEGTEAQILLQAKRKELN